MHFSCKPQTICYVRRTLYSSVIASTQLIYFCIYAGNILFVFVFVLQSARKCLIIIYNIIIIIIIIIVCLSLYTVLKHRNSMYVCKVHVQMLTKVYKGYLVLENNKTGRNHLER